MRSLLLLVLGAFAAGGVIWTSRPDAPSTSAVPAEPMGGGAETDAAPAAPRRRQERPPTKQPEPADGKEKELEPFTPTEQVPADSAISFPADI